MEDTSSRLRDFPSFLWLVLILLTASGRLYAADWASGLELGILLALLGGVLGLAIGLSRLRGLWAFLLACCCTLVLPPALGVWTLCEEMPLVKCLVHLQGRLTDSFSLLVTNQPIEDAILLVVFASLGFWVIGLTAGYALSRSANVAAAVIPAGIALVIVQLFDAGFDRRAIALAVYLFLCLLLLGRIRHVRQQQAWERQRLKAPAQSVRDMKVASLVTALVLVILAWAIPAPSRPMTSVREWWDTLHIDDAFGDSFLSSEGGSSQAIDLYADRLELGPRAEQGEEVIFHIYTPPFHKPNYYYWRVRTYDLYRDGAWSSTALVSETVGARQRPFPLADASGPTGEFIFNVLAVNLTQLVTPAQPVWVNRDSTLIYFPVEDKRIDPVLLRVESPVLAGEEYTVHAHLSNPTLAQLSQAGEEYPSWVKAHYLQLPPDFPQDVIDLAKQVAAGAETPYEKTVAITNYLRATIAYTEAVELPPGEDPIRWFLLEGKQGFCNYYATAEVLMLRSIGIPARLVVGFAEGMYQPPDQYLVRQKDAHAWPEVYFPGVGWVEFEPTSARPPLTRPSEDASAGPSASPTPTPDTLGTTTPLPTLEDEGGAQGGGSLLPGSLSRLLLIFGVLILVIFGLAFAYLYGLLDRALEKIRSWTAIPAPVLLLRKCEDWAVPPPSWLRRWAYYAQQTPAERAFGVVYWALHGLRENSSSARTPAEAAAILLNRLPSAAGEIETLLKQVQLVLYSQSPGDLQRALQAAAAIRRAAWREILRQRWQTVWKRLG